MSKGAKIGIVIIIILTIATIAAYMNLQSGNAKRDKVLEMMARDCWALDSTWNEEKNYYDPLPTKWDCSRDQFGNPKY